MKLIHFEILVSNSEFANFHVIQWLNDFSSNGNDSEETNYCISNKLLTECNVPPKTTALERKQEANTNLETLVTGCGDTVVSQGADDTNCKVLLLNQTINNCKCLTADKNSINCTFKIESSGHFLMAFHKTLLYSTTYRNLVLNNLLSKNDLPECNPVKVVTISLPSLQEINAIDYKWNLRLQNLWLERQAINNAMAWLSTLGGASSALGDANEHFAAMAAQISAKQFRLAIKLGDNFIACRCKLYYALSLIQRGYLKLASKIIKDQYRFAKKNEDMDDKLVSVCLGVHATLRYERNRRIRINNSHGNH